MVPKRASEDPAQALIDSIVGFGSMRKSYYPELRRRLSELETFRTLLDSGNDLILLTELPRGIITDANLPACRRLGWARAELLGRPLAEVVEGGDLDALLAGEAGGRPAQIETYFRCRDGGIFPVELTCRVAEAGAARSAMIVARDITERRCFECELTAAKEKAERASLAKAKFLAAASHDLRQPAQSLSLFATLLREEQPTSRVVEHLQNSVDALRLLLDALLDVSRLDAGLVVPEPKPFSIACLLTRLRAEYEIRGAEKGLKVNVLPSGEWLLSDQVLLENILRNFIENAIRYTERGGVVVGCRRRGASADIEVWDSGIGIPPGQMDAIFEEFHQVGNAARDHRKGLGLGLAVVRRLSVLLGHEVKVNSTLGRGSRFSVNVPLAEAGTPCVVTAPACASCQGMSVLLIDDEAMVRTSIRMLLESWGCHVREAASSAEAVAIDPGTCQFVVADFELKDETGTEAIAAVQRAAGRPIPSIILTGDTAPEPIAEASAHGYRVLRKPVTAESLRGAICRRRLRRA